MLVPTRRPRRAYGVFALVFALLLPVAGMALASDQSASQPLAPAVLGGGSALLGLMLGRWGLRRLRSGRSYRPVLEFDERSTFLR